MQPRVSIITLGVADLERSFRFYRDGMGLILSGPQVTDHAVFALQPGLNLVLYPRSEIASIVSAPGANRVEAGPDLFSAETPTTILSYVASTREEVTAILRDAEVAGGRVPRPPIDQAWGYTGYFQDPDGHLWEVMWHPELPEAEA